MENYKKYLLILILLLLGIFIAPVVIAYLGVVLSPYISSIGFILILFGITVVIAYKNRVKKKDRKQIEEQDGNKTEITGSDSNDKRSTKDC